MGPSNIYLIEVSNRLMVTIFYSIIEITIRLKETPENGVKYVAVETLEKGVKYEHISELFLVFLLFTLNR